MPAGALPTRPRRYGFLDSSELSGQDLDLTPTELRLLRTLSRHPGRVSSRDQLLEHLHDDGRAVMDRTVDSHVCNIRSKLEQRCDSPIRSVCCVGYSYEWPAP